MTFTDDDLKQMKEYFIDEPIHSAEELEKFMNQKGKALFIRLEAAEKALVLCEFDPDSTKEEINESLMEWLKSKGETGCGE